MIDTLRFAALTAAALVVLLIALAAGAMIMAGLVVAGAIPAIFYSRRAREILAPLPGAVVIEGEYREVPPRASR